MSQQRVTQPPESTTQRIARRKLTAAATQSGHGGSLSPFLQLQRSLGNQRVAQLIQAKRLTPQGKILDLQPKLTVGAADDQYEKEADRVSRHVMSMPDSVALAALQPAPPTKENAGHPHSLQSKPLPLAASITPFVQRTPHKVNDREEDKEQDKPDEVVQARHGSNPVFSPLQRQEASKKKEDEPVQAKRLAGTSPETLQRQSAAQEEDRDSIQAKSAASLAGSFDAGTEVESRLSQSKGVGSPLPDPVRHYMEPRFGVDFRHVRVHTGSDAVQMNRDVAAQAFTHGADIYYGAGSSPTNLELTAHELTHVVQQTGVVPVRTKRPAETISGSTEPSILLSGSAPNSSMMPQVLDRLKASDATPDLLEPKGTAPTNTENTVAAPPSNAGAKDAKNGKEATTLVGSPTQQEAGPRASTGQATSNKPEPQEVSGHSNSTAPSPTLGKESGEVEGQVTGPKAAAPSPREAIGPAVAAVHQRASGSHKHAPPGVAVASAQAAAKNPTTEQTRDAATKTIANINNAADQTKAIKRDDFKAKLKAAIEKATPIPKTESQADEVMKTGATKTRSTMHGHLATERDAAEGPLKSAASTEAPPSTGGSLATTTLQPEPIGPPPAAVSPTSVVPAALPPEKLDYSSDREPADKAMAENNVKKEQLQKGNEPAFGAALNARSTAEKHESAAAGRYRQSEADVHTKAHGAAQATLTKDLAGMHGSRAQHIGQVGGKQVETKTKDAIERQRITDKINEIKNTTKKDVDRILKPMETEAEKIFETGLTQAEKAYSDTFEEEKGGVGTWLTTWGDDWKDLIERSLAKARREYLRQVDDAVDKVATYVETQLAAAKKRVGDGLKEVQNFVNGLDKSVAQFGQDALQTVAADFDAMRVDIDERRDNLIDKLAQQYKDSSERMSAMETKLRDENKSLWQRVYDATVGLVKKILAFKDMLLGILAKAADAISDIIDDPIGFLGNLVSAIAQGLNNFMSNIGTHLKKGLMAWLFGALAGAGLQLPEAFDLKGIVSIVLQVLGLTYANFRARAVAIVGEPVVGALEKTAEVFKVLVTEGIPGIWRFIQEKVGDLKAMVLDAIFDFIKDSVIVAGIKWVIGLLNPASAFFKACMAIYDIVMFFINRGSQIIELVNAVTDSVAPIAKGALGAAAGKVEGALAKAVPVTIGFLAGLLGLGDISGTIKNTINKAQAPINKAVDWVIKMASKGLKAAGKLLGFGKDKPDERTAEQKQSDLDKGVAEATTLLEDKELSPEQVKKKLPAIKSKYRMTALELVTDDKSETKETDHVHGEINPKKNSGNVEKQTPLTAGELMTRVLTDLRQMGATRENIQELLPALETKYKPMGLRELKIVPRRKGQKVVGLSAESTAAIEGHRSLHGTSLPDYGEVTAIVSIDGKPIPHPTLRNLSGEHAEERIIQFLQVQIPRRANVPRSVEMLISQSPCRKRCALQVAGLRTTFPNTDFVVYYSSLHGSTSGKETESSMAAVESLTKIEGLHIYLWSGKEGKGEIESPDLTWLK